MTVQTVVSLSTSEESPVRREQGLLEQGLLEQGVLVVGFLIWRDVVEHVDHIEQSRCLRFLRPHAVGGKPGEHHRQSIYLHLLSPHADRSGFSRLHAGTDVGTGVVVQLEPHTLP